MRNMTPFEISVRSQLRRLGITRYLRPQNMLIAEYYRRRYALRRPSEVTIACGDVRARMLTGNEAEYVTLLSKREDIAFMKLLQPHLVAGAVFWDIGSNIGFYSILAAKLVGRSGRVIAFEPEPGSRRRLEQNIAINDVSNITIVPAALGRTSGRSTMSASSEPSAGTHKLTLGASPRADDASLVEVEVSTGDEIAPKYARPNVVKLDVEGFELDVLDGMARTLASAECRAVLCEVHFAQLEARGEPDGPLRVAATLKAQGFERQEWVDGSHLLAVKES